MNKGNPRSSGYEKQPDQWYREPRHAIDALLDAEQFGGLVWDPCCGSGNIPQACLDRRIAAIGSDIVNRGWERGFVSDFLVGDKRTVDHVICNPPFNLAVPFVLRGLRMASGKVAVLQRTAWLEGERRYQLLFSRGHLARIWQFRSRISMPPGDSAAEAKGGSVAFAWFVFDKDQHGAPELGWLP